MIRKLVNRLNESLKDSLSPARRKICVPVTISVEPELTSVRRKETGKLVMREELPNIKGETQDLSENGIAVVLSSVRLGQHYLVGEGRTLNITLDLPNGKVDFQGVAQRHKPIGTDSSATIKYLIGIKITKISEDNLQMYTDYLTSGRKGQNPKGKNLTLGITNN